MRLDSSVHYGHAYDNAFWDGTQMVYGDGDGKLFERFTLAVDVIGHELTHGVTQSTSQLEYVDQSGALNEAVSDIFGTFVEHSGKADPADWLIGEGLFTSKVQGVALRSMKAPGTAYDDPVLGKDPQPATMKGYVETTDDDGGVHINSGIPNRAFYLAAVSIGGNAWEKAGQIWYDALAKRLRHDSDFPAAAIRPAAKPPRALRLFRSGSQSGQRRMEASGSFLGETSPVAHPRSQAALRILALGWRVNCCVSWGIERQR